MAYINETGNISLNGTDKHILNDLSTISWQTIILGVFLVLVAIVTFLGNIMVFIAVARDKRLRTPFNYYIVNLAVTDISVSLTAMSFYAIDNLLGYWPFGDFLCGFWIFSDYAMTFESIFTLIMISLDRFWSVTWSLHYRMHSTKKKTLLFIVFSWFFMIALWVPAFATDRAYNEQSAVCGWDPSQNVAFVIVLAIIGYHGPCLVLVVCYIKVFIFMKQRMKVGSILPHRRMFSRSRPTNAETSMPNFETTVQTAVGSDDNTIPANSLQVPRTDAQCTSKASFPAPRSSLGQNQRVSTTTQERNAHAPVNTNGLACISSASAAPEKHQTTEAEIGRKGGNKEKRVFITLTYIVVGFFICWLPWHIVFDVSAANAELVPASVYTFAIWMAYINSTLNPFLYNFSNVEFRNAFKKIIFCK